MAIDTSIPRTRRAVLGAGLGAFVAVVATALGRPVGADAATGDPLLLGKDNTSDDSTSVSSPGHIGIQGISESYIGVQGTSNSYEAVQGLSSTGTGVHGRSNQAAGYAAGVYGESVSPGGVGAFGNNHATSGNAVGAQGTSHSPTGLALVGWADAGGLAVSGFSGGRFPAMPSKTGVHGRADQDGSSVGVSGFSAAGRGGLFAGQLAQLRMTPSTAVSHPASGAAGDFFVDKSGRLWFCKGGTIWKQLA